MDKFSSNVIFFEFALRILSGENNLHALALLASSKQTNRKIKTWRFDSMVAYVYMRMVVTLELVVELVEAIELFENLWLVWSP